MHKEPQAADSSNLSARSVVEAFTHECAGILTSSLPEDLENYGRDWTRVITPQAGLIVFPRSTQEVVQTVRFCRDHHIGLVPSGGRTGLAGGAVALNGQWVLSLQKMTRMESVDSLSSTVRVQAGAVTEAVHEHCAPFGLTWPVDFASKGSSQVGGNIATNAGGVRVVRYGLTRNWVLGLQVVTGSGEVLELNGSLEKNNTGYDLRQLFIGSEGTLGIITEATLKLARIPENIKVYLFAVPDLLSILSLFREARLGPFRLQAYEFFTDICLKRVQLHRGIKAPFPESSPYYVLLETEEETAGMDAWFEQVMTRGWVTDAIQAQNLKENAEIWAMREGISESLAATGVPHKNDVALPIHELGSFCESLEMFFLSHYPDWEICLFGHIGDGNLHINVMKPETLSKEEFLKKTKQVDSDLFTLVHKHHGSISAEHGIGLLKKAFLGFSRTPVEIEIFRGIKSVMDPTGIMNPGKVFE